MNASLSAAMVIFRWCMVSVMITLCSCTPVPEDSFGAKAWVIIVIKVSHHLNACTPSSTASLLLLCTYSWDDANDSPTQVIDSASNHAHDANAASTIPVPTQLVQHVTSSTPLLDPLYLHKFNVFLYQQLGQ